MRTTFLPKLIQIRVIKFCPLIGFALFAEDRFMAKKPKRAAPAHVAVGRVVRALTYPIIGAEHDFTLRELNALATLAHVNIDAGARVSGPEDGYFHPVDSYDAMLLQPGAGQSFWLEEQFQSAARGLEAKGLVKIQTTTGRRYTLFVSSKPEPEQVGPGMLVTLTKEGTELVDSMAGNLAKALTTLDDKDVRNELGQYESVG
ncbi:hypothetical protein GPA27_16330 [Aromatoleum toluolicum]|uniref:Uncharacterized protein n=1 Tax=Aromatoleum toluolicum TaxID=90060 RepID=A0ABX1NI14_9RHOO|nr:hypothetical protein [Aromatoleum toluolicum]NMF98947.1 hypothetical protein [Aromatoleum toluolicum]